MPIKKSFRKNVQCGRVPATPLIPYLNNLVLGTKSWFENAAICLNTFAADSPYIFLKTPPGNCSTTVQVDAQHMHLSYRSHDAILSVEQHVKQNT